jgi:hypothetical protein
MPVLLVFADRNDDTRDIETRQHMRDEQRKTKKKWNANTAERVVCTSVNRLNLRIGCSWYPSLSPHFSF